MDAYGEPEVQIWRESKLDSTHEPFWYTADGEQEVRLTNPYDLAVNHDELRVTCRINPASSCCTIP